MGDKGEPATPSVSPLPAPSPPLSPPPNQINPRPGGRRPLTPPGGAAVVVLLKATGDAPILKQSKFKVGVEERFTFVVDFLRKQLKAESVFTYLNSAFVPALDEKIGILHQVSARRCRCGPRGGEARGTDGLPAQLYATENKLVINYATTPAWG